MTILDLPLPDKPDYFGADGAPPGVALDLDAYATLDDGTEWLSTRPKITPRVGVVHTNAASGEATVNAKIRWGTRSRNNTKPHYQVNWPMPTKTLATDRRGIANSTGRELEEQFDEVDCSFWSYAIETADTGTNDDPAISDFLTESVHGTIAIPHAEIVARIFAYESIVWDHPIQVPIMWNGTGIVTHTWPHPYPAYTTKVGKTCPGDKKKATFRTEIVARALAIRNHWLAPDPEPEPEPPAVTDLFAVARAGEGYWSLARRLYGVSSSADVKLHADALAAVNEGRPINPGDTVLVPGIAQLTT